MELLVWYGGQYAQQLGLAEQKIIPEPKRTSDFDNFNISGAVEFVLKIIHEQTAYTVLQLDSEALVKPFSV